jgi:hypothetical protein
MKRCYKKQFFTIQVYRSGDKNDSQLLSNGLVDVVFLLGNDNNVTQLNEIADIHRDRRFVMVESQAYFEAYRPVLQGLQNLNDNNFPFAAYIVRCQNNVGPPGSVYDGEAIKG